MKTLFNISDKMFIGMLFFVQVGFLACSEKQVKGDYYGQEFETENANSVSSLLTDLNQSSSKPVKIEAVIDEVCQSKGCWMTLKTADDTRIRVTFKDYGFFVPKDAMGKTVYIDGMAELKELDSALLKHYAEDAGKPVSEMTAAEVSIIADGVLIL